MPITANQPQSFTLTRRELELLVAIAAREQRYNCVDALLPGCELTGRVQNAPAPQAAKVIAAWEKAIGKEIKETQP